MNKDTAAGFIKKEGGEARAEIAKRTGDNEGYLKGKADQAAGLAQQKYGEAKTAVKTAIKNATS